MTNAAPPFPNRFMSSDLLDHLQTQNILRACGEHDQMGRPLLSTAGSSPRMRGTLQLNAAFLPFPRFIPAHAGNTCRPSGSRRISSVHPRACGEHFRNQHFSALICGSSPRMRGTLMHSASPVRNKRFIPAHAGNTDRDCQNTRHETVHPRACGEHRPFDE